MWIYPVDMKRHNEFGQVFEKEKNEDSDEMKKTANPGNEIDELSVIAAEDQTKTRKRNVKD